MDIAQKYIDRHNSMKSQRSIWETHWQECSRYILPTRGEFTTKTTKGAKLNDLFDSTAPKACEKLASSMLGSSCNPADRWVNMEFQKIELAKDNDATAWIQELEEIFYTIFRSPIVAFYPNMHEFFLEYIAYGTAIINIEEMLDHDSPIRFQAIPLQQVYINENENGIVDVVHREYSMSLRNILNKFPDIQGEIKEKLSNKALKDPFANGTILHCVTPSLDKGGFPFKAYYILLEEKIVLGEAGYYENPYIVGRWQKMPGEIYGRSPGMSALADIKMLNAISKTIINLAQKTVNPPVVFDPEVFMKELDLSPAGQNPINASYVGGNISQHISPIPFGGNFSVGFEVENQRRQSIREVFMMDMLIDDKRAEMTATEAIQREQARMRVLAPQLARLHSELFNPLINRVYNILKRGQYLPPLPDNLEEGEAIKLSYISPLAKAQKALEISSIQQALQQLLPLSQFDPNAMQVIDTAKLVQYMVRAFDLPMSIIRTDEQLQELQAQAQEQQAMSQGVQDMKVGSEAVKNINEVMMAQQGGM